MRSWTRKMRVSGPRVHSLSEVWLAMDGCEGMGCCVFSAAGSSEHVVSPAPNGSLELCFRAGWCGGN